jgi:hypothetical protein
MRYRTRARREGWDVLGLDQSGRPASGSAVQNSCRLASSVLIEKQLPVLNWWVLIAFQTGRSENRTHDVTFNATTVALNVTYVTFWPGPSDSFPGHAVPEAMKHLVWWDTSLLLNEFLNCPAVPYRIGVPPNNHTSKGQPGIRRCYSTNF